MVIQIKSTRIESCERDTLVNNDHEYGRKVVMSSNYENRVETESGNSLVDIYSAMQLLPLQLTNIIEDYHASVMAQDKNADRIKKESEDRKNNSERDLSNKRSQRKRALQEQRSAQIAERDEITERLSTIIQQMDDENKNYLALGNLLQHKNARGKRYQSVLAIMKEHDQILDDFEVLKREVEAEIQTVVNEAYFEDMNSRIDREYNKEYSAILVSSANEKRKAEEDYTRSLDSCRKELIDQIERLKPKVIKTDREKCQLQVPINDGFQLAEIMPETVCIADSALDLSRFRGNSATSFAADRIFNYFDFGLEMRKGKRYLTFPYGQSFSSETFNKIIEYDFESRDMALGYLTAIEMRLFQSIPAGKLRVTMFDPFDLGKNFAMFSVLGEDDDRVISTKIWHETDRMKEKLQDLVMQISHVNQDCLKGIYTNIVEYNNAVGKNAEPLQALFIADFSIQFFDAESCRLLNQILRSGQKCGVFCFIAGNHDAIETGLGNEAALKLDKFVFKHGRMSLQSDGRKDMDMFPISLPGAAEREGILKTLKSGIKKSDRIVIDFNEASDDLLFHQERWFQYLPGKEGITVPVGIEGANKKVEIGLGGVRTQHHILVSGTIGSGKSSFLHTLIISLLLHYSPEDVHIYLLDFKKGVEFKVYSEHQLPNFKVISTDTTPEYGLAVLKHLCEERARIESILFKKDNISTIEEYNEKYPTKKISRNILIIDEFHEMFANPESDIAKNCHYYLQQLVKQGRAWGLYVVLASQKLPESCMDIYHQMLNRIALQSTEEVAKMILDSDNPGINMLATMDVGSGIFNDNGGHRDSNRILRVAYLNREQLMDTLSRIKERQEALGYNKIIDEEDKMILDVNSLSDAQEHPLTMFVKNGSLPPEKEFGYPLYFAKALSLSEKFEINLCSDDGQNLLIAGPEDNRVKRILGISAMSILFYSVVVNDGVLPHTPIITYFDFSNSRKSYGTYDIMNELSAAYPEQIRVFGKDTVLFGIEQLEMEIQKEEFDRHFVIFAGLNRAKKLLSKRTYEKSPRDRLVRMMEEGPSKGVNFIVWANEPETFLEFYSDAIDFFDYRVGFELQEDTFKNLFLSAYIETGDDNNAVSYSVDDGNLKIRIYDDPLKDYVDGFIDQIDQYLQEGEFDE